MKKQFIHRERAGKAKILFILPIFGTFAEPLRLHQILILEILMEETMFDKKSDYSLNKMDPDAIVCKSVTGVHIRLTEADFSSVEEFRAWKAWSDADFHA